MKRPYDTSMVPKGGKWTYRHFESGFSLSHPYYEQLKTNVKQFFVANNYPIGLLFNDEFDENICSNADVNSCVDYVPPTALEKMSRLGQAISKWAMSGFKVRSQEDVEKIRATCQSCPDYGGEKGFLKVICKRCGCSNKKLFLISEHCPLPQPKW